MLYENEIPLRVYDVYGEDSFRVALVHSAPTFSTPLPSGRPMPLSADTDHVLGLAANTTFTGVLPFLV